MVHLKLAYFRDPGPVPIPAGAANAAAGRCPGGVSIFQKGLLSVRWILEDVKRAILVINSLNGLPSILGSLLSVLFVAPASGRIILSWLSYEGKEWQAFIPALFCSASFSGSLLGEWIASW